MLPSVLPRLATDSAWRVFPGVWKPLFLKFPSRDGLPFPGRGSLPTSFVSFFVFYIFSYLFLKTMVCFSGCTTGAPSQADVDCPEPQEVLAKKPAYSFVDNVSLGLRLPPSSSGCLSPEWCGLQPATSVQSFVPCAGLAVS